MGALNYLSAETGIFFSLLFETAAMTLKYFRNLSETKQFRRLLTKGVCVGERLTEDTQVLLFQLDRFYVEVAFNKNTDEAVSARSFENTDELAPYLEAIDINDIFEQEK